MSRENIAEWTPERIEKMRQNYGHRGQFLYADILTRGLVKQAQMYNSEQYHEDSNKNCANKTKEA